ncbi:enoyl-CoA hydratase/isomerase family protein [Alsobacter sp. SYSU M60028]|uniref:3-hydroxyisobutyryl-CoA hydrolase n=1 Tax=Alsobacter ponti TaxID=2962936 RepID=A0ABT1LA47_9HYPH|nr:enoyl-CoA hydratase/isomerase family protein [Alsobacter ponti]MCP8938362.1 enoyl-CoA hydratase/isomerase family protein [Alsobacter ponti]
MTSPETTDPTSEAVCERIGAAGVITLNRPQALNALTLGMVRAVRAALDRWERDPAVTRVVIRGAGDRAFCAGGDIRRIHDCGKAGQRDEPMAFWREEYELNIRIKRYAKPYVALVDGIVMGGGVGMSAHGSHRVASERALFAMPEVGIGFFPDVGATYFLPRLPGAAGMWLALTGARIRTADLRALGLATHVAPSAAMAGIVERLAAGDDVDATLAAHDVPPGASPWQAERATVDRCFAADSVAGVLGELDRAAAEGSAFAAEAAAAVRTKSPTSLGIAFEQVRRGASLDFEAAMALEFRVVSRMLDNPDFYEGVRAVVVDKDQKPRWSPAALQAVDPAAVAAFFEPVAAELVLQAGAAR